MTQEEINYIKFVVDCLKNATDFELDNHLRTKEEQIEMKEYKQHLRDIHLYNYELKQPPSFFQIDSFWKRQIDRYKQEEGITIELGITL